MSDQVVELNIVIHAVEKTLSSVIVTFADQRHADVFYLEFGNKPFSEMGKFCPSIGVCQLAFLGKSSEGPDVGLFELPSCPVCLQRLDQHVSGMLSVCNHKTVCHCLAYGTEQVCLTCRFCQGNPVEVCCAKCEATDALWICLACRHIGCGRFSTKQHALEHYRVTGHRNALELTTQRVWDYLLDEYVHRMLQPAVMQTVTFPVRLTVASPVPQLPPPLLRFPSSEVEEDPTTEPRDDGEDRPPVPEEAAAQIKLESILDEYNRLLTDQFKQQRSYFELKLGGLSDEIASISSIRDALSDKASFAVETKRLEAAQAGLQKKMQRLEKLKGELRGKLSHLQPLREANKNMRASHAKSREEIEAARKAISDARESHANKIAELKSQVNDLAFYLKTSAALQSMPDGDDVKEGHVLITQGDTKSKRRRSRHKYK